MSQTRLDFSVLAGEDLAAYRLCKLDSADAAVYADAGDIPRGVTVNGALDTEPVLLESLMPRGHTREMTASAAITKGDRVYTAADGKISSTMSGVAVGWALATASGDGSIIEVLVDVQENGLLYVNVAASAEVENTDVETAFDKSFTIPANFLKAGDVLRVKVLAYVLDNNGTDTLTLALKIGSTTVIATAAVNVEDADIGLIEADIVIRTIGGSGTFVAHGTQILDAPGTAVVAAHKASTAIDTTATQAITVSALWSAAHADNEVYLDVLSVELIRP